MKKIKVLHIITGGLHWDGITLTQLEFFKHMNLNVFEIDVAAVHDDEQVMIDEFVRNSCRVMKFPDRRKHTIIYFFSLLKEIRKRKPDIVHVHGSSAIMSIELLAAKMAGVKVRIAHSRNTQSDHMKIDKILRPLFACLYTYGLACGIDAGRWMFGDKPFTVIHNGKDFNKFAYSDEIRRKKRMELNLEEKIVIGHVGKMNYQKNHQYLLNIFNEIQKKHSNAILYLMGDGPLKKDVQRQADEMKIADKIIFAGSICDVPQILPAMDIMVFPSRFEGLPNVVLEWQAEGIPCLISDNITDECAPSDLVEFASIKSSPKIWADKVDLMLDHFSDRRTQAKQGMIALKQNGFDIDDALKQLEDIYLKLTCK